MNPVITIVSRDIIRKQEPKVTLKYFVETLEIRERLGERSLNLKDTCALYLLVPSGAWTWLATGGWAQRESHSDVQFK